MVVACGTTCTSRSRRVEFELLVEDGHPGEVPARPGEAADETDRDRVAAAGKGDGDGGGRGLGGARGGIAEGGDDRHVAGHQLGCQGRQPVELTVRPAKLEGDVAVRDVAPLGEAFLKRGHRARALVARMEEADHRHRRLLRARRERPSCRRAAEERDELASFHSITSSARASSMGDYPRITRHVARSKGRTSPTRAMRCRF